MGQLEKYGLYVLCLVIFLILGVTIWGGADAPAPGQRTPPVAINANPGNQPARGDSAGRSGNQPGAEDDLTGTQRGGTLADLLKSQVQPIGNRDADLGPRRMADAVDDGGARRLEVTPIDAGDRRQSSLAPPDGPNGEPSSGVLLYTIKSGDTFAGIAKSQLGSETRMDEIAKLNPGVDPRRLKLGSKIKLPSGSAATPGKEALVRAGAYQTYIIGKGDTFESIARKQLESIRRVADIKALNPDLDPRKLRIGKAIKLPIK